MGKKLPHTPNSQIRSALRKLFLRSRERSCRLKIDNYTCQCCGAKQSRAAGREVYVEVDHREGICNWQALFEAVRENLLCDPADLRVLCKDCHQKASESAEDRRSVSVNGKV